MTTKVALVTGGNSGIGRSIVDRFCAEGFAVGLIGRNADTGEAAVAELSGRGASAAFFKADLSDENAARDAVDRIVERFGRLDVTVNNAGLGSRRSGVETTDGPGVRWDKIRGSNLDSAWYVSAHSLSALTRTGGAIVNISSTAAMHGNWGTYGIAKAAVEALTRSFAFEGAPHGVRVNCVSPGWIATSTDQEIAASGKDGWQQPPSVFNRMGRPGEIADAVFFLASERASFITGQTLVVDGGLSITDYPSIALLSTTGHTLFSGMA